MYVSGSSCTAAVNIRSGAVCLHKFMWWFWPPWRKKKKILFVYVIFLNKQSLFPLIHSQFPLSLFRPSKPTRLSQFSLLQSHSVRSLFISCSRGWDAASIRIPISWLGATNRVFHVPAIFLDCIILKANTFLRIKDPRVSSVASWIPLSFLYIGQHQQGG